MVYHKQGMGGKKVQKRRKAGKQRRIKIQKFLRQKCSSFSFRDLSQKIP